MIKNKEINIKGLFVNAETMELQEIEYTCFVTNDENGKTLSICGMDDKHQIILPFEPLEPYLKD